MRCDTMKFSILNMPDFRLRKMIEYRYESMKPNYFENQRTEIVSFRVNPNSSEIAVFLLTLIGSFCLNVLSFEINNSKLTVMLFGQKFININKYSSFPIIMI